MNAETLINLIDIKYQCHLDRRFHHLALYKHGCGLDQASIKILQDFIFVIHEDVHGITNIRGAAQLGQAAMVPLAEPLVRVETVQCSR